MDRNRVAIMFALAFVAGGALWWWSRARAGTVDQGDGGVQLAQEPPVERDWSWLTAPFTSAAAAVEQAAPVLSQLVENVVAAVTPGTWSPPERAAPYLDAIHAAEDRNGMPRNLLARLIHQESRYREDIITGQVKSSAGAVGIAQIVPRWHPGVDPLDSGAAINYASDYLTALYRQFGSWQLALAAYNWGPGNLKAKGIGAAPKETRDYIAQIGADVGLV